MEQASGGGSLARRAERRRPFCSTRPGRHGSRLGRIVDPNITMSAYAERWLQEIAVTIKPKTHKSYGLALRLHILPALGSTKVRMLQKGRSQSFLVERLRQGKVRTIGSTRKEDGHRGFCRSARPVWWAVKDSNLGPAD
jgi:integrase-like protein